MHVNVEKMTFSAPQQQALFHGTIEDIRFRYCDFEQGGTPFLEEMRTRNENGQEILLGETSLAIEGKSLFDSDEKWDAFFSLLPTSCKLVLEEISPRESILSMPNIESLCTRNWGDESFFGCLDWQNALINNQGPRKICTRGWLLIADEADILSFFQAFAGNNHVEELDIDLETQEDIVRALDKGLATNEVLRRLKLKIPVHSLEADEWQWLVDMFKKNKSVKHWDVSPWIFEPVIDHPDEEKIALTQRIIDLLKVNDTLVTIEFPKSLIDEELWNKHVLPRLAMNEYREDFSRFRTLGDAETRAAFAHRAFSRFTQPDRPLSTRLTQLWQLVHQNRGIIANSLLHGRREEGHQDKKQRLS